MKVLGISPLDKDATVSIVEDGVVRFAAGEERFSRKKQHAGFPAQALEAAFEWTKSGGSDIERVGYAFLDAEQESRLMRKQVLRSGVNGVDGQWRRRLRSALSMRAPQREPVPGLADPNKKMRKGVLKDTLYWLFGVVPGFCAVANHQLNRRWVEVSSADHQHWQAELEHHLRAYGLATKLERFEHHLSHAANSYFASGLDRALIVTLDGYGTGLAGSVGLGEGGKIKRLRNFHYPSSLGTFYEGVTAALGFRPDRHAGKIVGLAAYGDPSVLSEVLLERFHHADGSYSIHQALNYFFDRYLASRFTMIDVAAAYQHVLEVVATRVVDFWVRQTACANVVLSGGVTANVKMNQRIFEVPGVERIFIYPNMGDGGCGTGLGLHLTSNGGVREPLGDVYLGPEYTDGECERALERAGLRYLKPNNLPAEIAERIHSGQVVARFGGRMEYGPRALGNRSILFHAKDPDVNQWLNHRLGRTEFMPFAPVTTWEDRGDFYHNLAGAEHAAEFMTITFDCTRKMREHCPAAVHVDGTARPQLIRRDVNPLYYDIVKEFEKRSGIPTLINTSFNMHEEPIVCSPDDAVRAYLDGRLDVLALGPFLVDASGRPDAVKKNGGAVHVQAESSATKNARVTRGEVGELVDERRFANGWRVRLTEVSNASEVEPLWRDLQGRADFSFFQSWGWIEAWLQSSPPEARSLMLEARIEDRPVGLAVLGHNTLRRHNVFSSQALLVTESGIPTCDALTVEHSGLLVERGLEADVVRQCLVFLRDSALSWDELYISGVEKEHAQPYIHVADIVEGLELVVRFDRPYFYVDLEALRKGGSAYLDTLSPNTRYQIRRSMRLYEKTGPLQLRVAEELDEACHMFDEMKKLHQFSWYRRGKGGAFLSQFSNRFHQRLIINGFARGEIQLARISAGQKTFGYLYNFVHGGMVLNYQSGFLYEDDPKYKPGLVSHCLAIERNRGLGHKAYDLLMGDQRFKRSLATNEAHMLALVLRQTRLKLSVEASLHKLWDRVRA